LDLCKLPEFPKVTSLATKLKCRSAKNFIGKNISGFVIGYIEVSNGALQRLTVSSLFVSRVEDGTSNITLPFEAWRLLSTNLLAEVEVKIKGKTPRN